MLGKKLNLGLGPFIEVLLAESGDQRFPPGLENGNEILALNPVIVISNFLARQKRFPIAKQK